MSNDTPTVEVGGAPSLGSDAAEDLFRRLSAMQDRRPGPWTQEERETIGSAIVAVVERNTLARSLVDLSTEVERLRTALTQALQESVTAQSTAFRAGVDAAASACRGFKDEQSEALATFRRFKEQRNADDAGIGVQVAAECERRVLALKAGGR